MGTDQKQEEYHFVKEKRKEIPPNRRKRAKSLGWTVVLAVVFGLVAALVFCCVKPAMEKLTAKKEDTVVLSADEEEETEENADVQSDPVYITETQQMELADYQVLQNKLYAVGREANKSVVAVTGIGQATDWFEDSYQTKNQGSGIILADTGSQYLAVTEKKLISDADHIEVTFSDDSTSPARLVAYDGNTGIAVLGVEKSELSQETLNRVEAATLGNSSGITQGTMVIAIGSPLGEPFSILTGNVTLNTQEVSTLDANYRVISTDISANTGGSGALININGDVVGLIMQDYGREDDQGTVTAIGISEIRALVEKMSNGETPAFLGLEITTVTADLAEENQLPEGVYIKSVQEESPALAAGLQAGDVIVKIGTTEILTDDEYEDYLLSVKAGDADTVTVKRMGADGTYEQIAFPVVYGTLN